MTFDLSRFRSHIQEGIPPSLPPYPPEEEGISHAPKRREVLSPSERETALKNALRYFPVEMHGALAPEFAKELKEGGRIYMRRFRPPYEMKARPIGDYPAKTRQAAAIMLMIQNNLDPAVAQHPYELITYGGNGTVFQNWAQYLLTMKYLCEMTESQTLVIYSGHPLGLFPSHKEAPRVALTNGMVIPNYSSLDDYDRLAALGVTSYGQMTAGSYMYIGPQGIVHGTVITILNAGRLVLGDKKGSGLEGMVFVSSGLGGMSGAQAKASVIAGAVGVIAEINPQAVRKRYEQGWVEEVYSDLNKLAQRMEKGKKERKGCSLAYEGNIVDLLEYLAEKNINVDLASDQTSLHNPYGGGYYPAGMTLEESNAMMAAGGEGFQERVHESLRRHVRAINALADRGTFFWDYGNAFLLQSKRAGADILGEEGNFRYPSYVENIMGPLCFDFGFGPFRWVCTSGDPGDLRETDRIAQAVLRERMEHAPAEIEQQIQDNLRWIEQAEENKLVVGSQARILYSDETGRISIALAFNRAIRDGKVKAPIVLGRDHHDVSGTDSPFRETANIRDGSMFCADMAVHTFLGNAFRGATWVSLHNGGGVGWGEVINGGFGMVLDGSKEADVRIRSMIAWDVTNGIARRAWARNPGAEWAIEDSMKRQPLLRVTRGTHAEDALVRESLGTVYGKEG